MSNVYNDNSIFPVDPGCPIRPLVEVDTTNINLKALKESRGRSLKQAEQTAWDYAKALDISDERIEAFDVCERIRRCCDHE